MLKVGLYNLKDEKWYTINLPKKKKEIQKFLKSSEINSFEITSCDIDWENSWQGITLFVTDDVYEINEFAKELKSFIINEINFDKYFACVEIENPTTLEEHINLLYYIDNYEFLPGIVDCEDYGRYIVSKIQKNNYDEELEDYIDYQKYGKDYLYMNGGYITEYGFLIEKNLI